jgi:hypothetical protein
MRLVAETLTYAQMTDESVNLLFSFTHDSGSQDCRWVGLSNLNAPHEASKVNPAPGMSFHLLD